MGAELAALSFAGDMPPAPAGDLTGERAPAQHALQIWALGITK